MYKEEQQESDREIEFTITDSNLILDCNKVHRGYMQVY